MAKLCELGIIKAVDEAHQRTGDFAAQLLESYKKKPVEEEEEEKEPEEEEEEEPIDTEGSIREITDEEELAAAAKGAK